MATKTFNLPDPGEGLTEAEIVTWRVAPGDAVKVNDIVVEIETSKSLVELPIPWEGTVGELLVAEGTEVPIGAPIITVVVAGDDAGDAGASGAASAESATAVDEKREPNLVGYGAVAGATTRRARRRPSAGAGRSEPGAAAGAGVRDVSSGAPAPTAGSAPAATGGSGPSAVPGDAEGGASVGAAAATPAAAASTDVGERPLTKPKIRRYCRDRGIDLTQVQGTGPEGVITWEDVDAHVAGHAPAATSGSAGASGGASPVASIAAAGREVHLPVKGVRKMTAQAMSASAFTAPHVTEFVTIDMTASMELVERLKADREFRDVKVSPLLLVAKALLLACRRNPGVNAVWSSDTSGADVIVQKNYVNLGIAAATPRGLVVPNIKDAHAMTLRELADAMATLVDTARAGRTQPADMAGGTITITNVGVFGVDTGTPIINPGESAILCFGAVRRMPWVVGSGADERIEPRWVTQLALSFDHRLIDGDLGSRFLADVAAVLTDPAKGLIWG